MSLEPNAVLALAALASFVPFPLAAWSVFQLGRTRPRWFEWVLCAACVGLMVFRLTWGFSFWGCVLWLALLICRAFQQPVRERVDYLLGALKLGGAFGGVFVALFLASFIIGFSGPRTRLERAVCHSSPGAPYSLFRAKAKVFGLEVRARGPNSVTTINSWLFMDYGCELTVDDGGMVTKAEMWSVG